MNSCLSDLLPNSYILRWVGVTKCLEWKTCKLVKVISGASHFCEMKHIAYSTWTLRSTERTVIFHRGFSREEKKAHNSINLFWSFLWREKNENRKWTRCFNNFREWKKECRNNSKTVKILYKSTAEGLCEPVHENLKVTELGSKLRNAKNKNIWRLWWLFED